MYKQNENKKSSIQYEMEEHLMTNKRRRKGGILKKGIALLSASMVFGGGAAVSFHTVDNMLEGRDDIRVVAESLEEAGTIQQLSAEENYAIEKFELEFAEGRKRAVITLCKARKFKPHIVCPITAYAVTAE